MPNTLSRAGRRHPLLDASRSSTRWLWLALAFSMCVGVLGRGYWTPDEPREADISWRMSSQTDKAVPLLAGEAFCEKPPLTYWIAGAAIGVFGADGWAARLPNLLYALITALAVASIGRRGAGSLAGILAAAAISTFLLSYQVAIWLATDAPLLAAVTVALLGLYIGFYANHTGERLRGYSYMHAAMAVGFLSKSAAAWMVPVLTIAALVVWERRWRELLRWELYAGVALQALLILTWVWFVYAGRDGPAHLKVFFWNNLVGRFAKVDAPDALQYAGAHQNSPGKYLIELPAYLWPWTLLVMAAVRRAIQARSMPEKEFRLVRFAIATFVPTLAVLSLAATARNIYLAPAFPGLALLLGWWARDAVNTPDAWNSRAIRGTSLLLGLANLVAGGAALLVGWDSWPNLPWPAAYVMVAGVGILMSVSFAGAAWRAAIRGLVVRGLFALVFAYCALLIGPASQIYRAVNTWQDLSAIGRAMRRDAGGRPIILFAPDETTRAFVDMYASTSVEFLPGPIAATTMDVLRTRLDHTPRSLVVTQMPGRVDNRTLRELAERLGLGRRMPPPAVDRDLAPAWITTARLRIVHLYALPNGRRYALLESTEL